MTFEIVNDLITLHVIPKEPGFRLNDRTWTKFSDYVRWKYGAMYCLARDTSLQTLDDAVEFRQGTNGADDSDYHQHTRTLIGYANDGRAGLRAFLWEPSFDEVRELLNHPQISSSHLQLSSKDALAKQIKRSDKTFLVPTQNPELAVAPNADGESAYSSNEIVQLFMPNHAKDNAAYIGQRYPTGIVWFDRPNLSKGEMRVRPICLGGNVNFSGISYVGADGYFGSFGWARGVAPSQKTSP